MVMTQELILSIPEIRWLAIECPRCHTRITYDMAGSAAILWQCPGCNQNYEQLRKSVETFRDAFKALCESVVPLTIELRTGVKNPVMATPST